MAEEIGREQAQQAGAVHSERHQSRTGSTYKAFIQDVCTIGGFDEELAECASVSVLCNLEQRIRGGEAKDMEAQLPFKLQELLHGCALHEGQKPEKFGREEFLRRVSEDVKKSPEETEGIVRAVLTAVRGKISEGEAEEFGNMLPADLRDLWMRPS